VVVVGAAADRAAEGLIGALGREVATGVSHLTIGKLLLPVVGIVAIKAIPFFIITPPSTGTPAPPPSTGTLGSLPVLEVRSSETPLIERHTEIALRNKYPSVLTYDENRTNADRRGNQACKSQARRRSIGLRSSYVPTRMLNECDEYPFRSTFEGGDGMVGAPPPGVTRSHTPGIASIAAVPANEQDDQAKLLQDFYRRNHLVTGNKFVVVTINDLPYTGPDPLHNP